MGRPPKNEVGRPLKNKVGRPSKGKVGRPPKSKEETAPDPYLDETIRIIARRLADTRKKLGLTQAQLGEKIGAGQSFVFELEQAASNMMLRTLLRMARGLEIDPRELFPGGPSPTASEAEIEFLISALDRLTNAIQDRIAYERLRDEHQASLLLELKPLVDLRNALAGRTPPEEADAVKDGERSTRRAGKKTKPA